MSLKGGFGVKVCSRCPKKGRTSIDVLPRRAYELLQQEMQNRFKERAMIKISKSQEDYLSSIVMLGGSSDHPIRSVDIAKRMGVSKTSVYKAIAFLKDLGLSF